MGELVKLELIANGNALDISDIDNYVWQGHSGFGLANLHRLILRGPQQHGDTDMGYLFDPRIIQLNIRLMGTDLDDLYDKQQELTGYANPNTNSTISLRFTRIAANIVRQIDAYVVAGLDFASSQRHGFTVLEGITLRASDPSWYDPSGVAFDFVAGGGSAALVIPKLIPFSMGASTIDNSQAFGYAGTSDSFPVITITGPVTDLVITNNTTGEKLDFTGVTIAGGKVYTIDTRYPYKTVVDEAVANKNGELTVDSNLASFHLAGRRPGENSRSNSIHVTGSAVSGATQINLAYFTRYISGA
jgi:hypothetical protein